MTADHDDTIILGVNRRGHPCQTGALVEYRVVLWRPAGPHIQFRASIGNGQDVWVARYGDPISFKEATIHFPYLAQQIPQAEELWEM